MSCTFPNYWNAATFTCEICPQDLVYIPQLGRCEVCPSSTPLIINGQCKACPTGTNYDKNSKVCVRCSSDSTFNPNTGLCDLIPIVTPPPKCSIGGSWSTAEGRCVCPSATPYDNGAVCIGCDLPYYWNATVKACSQCPDGQVYNTQQLSCQYCPISAPIERDGSCVSCPADSYYVPSQRVCLACPVGSTFNQANFTCTLNANLTTPQCPTGATYNSQTKACVCPLATPFNNGQQCTTCPNGQHWNITTSQC